MINRIKSYLISKKDWLIPITGFDAFGAQIYIGDGATPTEAFTAVAEIGDVEGPDMSKEAIDMTHHASAGKTREFASGLRDSGTLAFPINLLPGNATHDETTGLVAKYEGDVLTNWKIAMADTDVTVYSFAGVLTGYSPKNPVDGKLSADIEIKISGPVTITTGGVS